MPIIIDNITIKPTKEGINKYLVRINRQCICEFEHKREDGLAVCLFKAAEAVMQSNNKESREDVIERFFIGIEEQ